MIKKKHEENSEIIFIFSPSPPKDGARQYVGAHSVFFFGLIFTGFQNEVNQRGKERFKSIDCYQTESH